MSELQEFRPQPHSEPNPTETRPGIKKKIIDSLNKKADTDLSLRSRDRLLAAQKNIQPEIDRLSKIIGVTDTIDPNFFTDQEQDENETAQANLNSLKSESASNNAYVARLESKHEIVEALHQEALEEDKKRTKIEKWKYKARKKTIIERLKSIFT